MNRKWPILQRRHTETAYERTLCNSPPALSKLKQIKSKSSNSYLWVVSKILKVWNQFLRYVEHPANACASLLYTWKVYHQVTDLVGVELDHGQHLDLHFSSDESTRSILVPSELSWAKISLQIEDRSLTSSGGRRPVPVDLQISVPVRAFPYSNAFLKLGSATVYRVGILKDEIGGTDIFVIYTNKG